MKKQFPIRFITLLALVFLRFQASGQTTVYVSPAGNDNNPGTLTLPYQTIQHAINTVSTGGTVYLMGGTYAESVAVSYMNTASTPIVLTNYNNQNAVISPPPGDSCCPLLHIRNATYFTVSGIEFAGYTARTASAIVLEGICKHIEVINNKIHDIAYSNDTINLPDSAKYSFAIRAYNGDNDTASAITISGNEIYHCQTGFHSCISLTGNIDGFSVSGNYIHDNSGGGISILGNEMTTQFQTPGIDHARNGTISRNIVRNCRIQDFTGPGIFADGARNCVIENNTCTGNGYGIQLGCSTPGDSTHGIIVRSNLIHGNMKAGIFAGIFGPQQNFGKVTDCTINNNSLYTNTLGAPFFGECIFFHDERIRITSNIVYGTHPQDVLLWLTSANLAQLDFNLYYSTTATNFLLGSSSLYTSFPAWVSATGLENASLNTDPLFVNAASGNLHLQSASPAIDKGDSLYQLSAGETDIDTMNRVQNGRVDIGADEYGTAVGIPSSYNRQEGFYTHLDRQNNLLTIGLPEILFNERKDIRIFDASGKTVKTLRAEAGSGTCQVYVGDLASGTYIVQATGNMYSGLFSSKFVR